MQDTKNNDWTGNARYAEQDKPDRQAASHGGDAGDVDGWHQYRRWISKTPAPRSRRNGLDPALYTWKGYRTWTEQVKRNWNES